MRWCFQNMIVRLQGMVLRNCYGLALVYLSL